MSDAEIVENSLPVVILATLLGVGTATYLLGDNVVVVVKETLRALICPANHRNPRQMAAKSAMPGAPAPLATVLQICIKTVRGHRDPDIEGASASD